MKQHDLDTFKKLLNERRQELMSEAMGTMHGMGMVEDGQESFPDPTDRASLEDNRNLTLRIRDRERKLITKIDEAIDRIDGGTYGVCEDCGGAIGAERLKARPVTTLCIQCKSDQEVSERRRNLA